MARARERQREPARAVRLSPAGDDQGRRLKGQHLLNDKQQAFLDFVLAQYVEVGVQELDREKLSPLLKLKYHALADAVADLGRPEEIGKLFAGFQRFLYQKERVA